MADIEKTSNSSKKVVSIAAGEAHTLSLTEDGSVFSWGRGTFGRLGTGKEEDELLPVQIHFDSSQKFGISGEKFDGQKPKFVEIAAGAYHSLALEDDGSVWCWGYNNCGQLGLNADNSLVPCFLERFLELGSPDSLTDESNMDRKTSLKGSGTFDIAKEWDDMLESADNGKLRRMEVFYRNMLTNVKDKLMKRRIKELITECLHSSTAGASLPM